MLLIGEAFTLAIDNPMYGTLEHRVQIPTADPGRVELPAMHELSIANGVVEICAECAGNARVIRVRLEIGRLSAVMPDAVRFCFDVCARNTVVEGAALEIVEIQGCARCRQCAREVPLVQRLGRCACGSTDLHVIAGDELKIREIEFA